MKGINRLKNVAMKVKMQKWTHFWCDFIKSTYNCHSQEEGHFDGNKKKMKMFHYNKSIAYHYSSLTLGGFISIWRINYFHQTVNRYHDY